MTRIPFAILLLALFSMPSVATAEQDPKDQAKQAAREACLEAATKKYGEGTADGRAHRKKIGRSKGYAFAMKVGSSKRKVNCLADSKGEVTFYGGQT